jgi:hypothetical protein
LLAATLLGVSACGGGAALMHPAHALPAGRVTLGAGVSNNFVLGDADAAIQSARVAAGAETQVSRGTPEEQAYVEGSIADTLVAPGLAPWVGARAGMGYDSDAGVTYTGRAVRVDARHAFQDERVALSVGGGATGRLLRPRSDAGADGRAVAVNQSDIPGLDAGGVTGWGVDVPVVVGYRTDADLVQVWAGARGGYERSTGEFLLTVDLDATIVDRADVDASRWYGGALLGLAVGVRPFWVGVELDATYHHLSGELAWRDTAPIKLQGVSLAPTGAVVGKF